MYTDPVRGENNAYYFLLAGLIEDVGEDRNAVISTNTTHSPDRCTTIHAAYESAWNVCVTITP